VTGTISASANGPGGVCAYYYPGEHKGFSYTASSKDFPNATSNVGGWSLAVQSDTGSNMLIYFNTDNGSWTGGRTVTGTVHADPNLHHVDFNVQLTKVIGQQHAQLTGSIDCP
jgi:hypothetical protein